MKMYAYTVAVYDDSEILYYCITCQEWRELECFLQKIYK